MTIYEYADTIRCYVHVVRYPQQEGRWTCHFLADSSLYSLDTKESDHSAFLTDSYGTGKTPNEAIANYCDEIRGKIVVLTRYSLSEKKHIEERYGVPESVSP